MLRGQAHVLTHGNVPLPDTTLWRIQRCAYGAVW